MPETSQDKATGAKTAKAELLFPAHLSETQAEGAALFARANDLLLETARTIWESQSDLVRVQAEEAAKAFVPMKPGDDPAAVVAAYWDQWHDGTERLIAHMRRVNDAARGYGWQLFEFYTEGFRMVEKPLQAATRPYLQSPL